MSEPPRAETFDERRPQELEDPQQSEEVEEADLLQGHPPLAEYRRERHDKEPEREVLRRIQAPQQEQLLPQPGTRTGRATGQRASLLRLPSGPILRFLSPLLPPFLAPLSSSRALASARTRSVCTSLPARSAVRAFPAGRRARPPGRGCCQLLEPSRASARSPRSAPLLQRDALRGMGGPEKSITRTVHGSSRETRSVAATRSASKSRILGTSASPPRKPSPKAIKASAAGFRSLVFLQCTKRVKLSPPDPGLHFCTTAIATKTPP